MLLEWLPKVLHDDLAKKKHSYLERKQKELCLPLKSDPKLFWKSFGKKDDLTLSFVPQEVVDYCHKIIQHMTKYHLSFCSNILLPNVFPKGNTGSYGRISKSQGW